MADGYLCTTKKKCNMLTPSAGAFTELHVERVVGKFPYRWQKAAINGSLSPRVVCPDTVEENTQMSRFAANILNNESRRADKGWSSSLGLGEVLTVPHRRNLPCYETFHKTSDLELFVWHDVNNRSES